MPATFPVRKVSEHDDTASTQIIANPGYKIVDLHLRQA
jgi:hypothetical protein